MDDAERIVNAPPFLPRKYPDSVPVAEPHAHVGAAPTTVILQDGYANGVRVVIVRVESVNGSFQFVFDADSAKQIANQLLSHATGLTIANGTGDN